LIFYRNKRRVILYKRKTIR